MRWLHFQFWLKALEIALSALASSAITSACVTKSASKPPYFFGTTSVRKPCSEPLRMRSQSQVLPGSAICSRGSDSGRMTSAANLRAFICHARCSSFNEKSM